MSAFNARNAAIALAAASLVACGEEETAAECSFEDASELYALAPQIAGASSGDYNTYLVLTDRLEGQDVPLDCSVELPGRALAAGQENAGAVFVAAGDAPTVTRYDLVDGKLKKGKTISFAARGLSAIGEYSGQFVFASETKAYFFDGSTAQVIVWNPKEMKLVDALSLAELVIPDATLTMSAAPLRVGNEIVMFPGWRTTATIPSKAGVIVVDTETDEVHIATDDRCGYVRDGILEDDGKIYMATEAVGTARFRIDSDAAPPPCLIRYDTETRAFDADFYVDLRDLFSGDVAGTLIRGPNNEAFLRVLDEERVSIDEKSSPRTVASAPAWRWAKVQLGDEPTASFLDHPPAGGSALLMPIGDKTYIPVVGETHTEFVELTSDGPGDVAVRVQGRLFSAVKIK